MATVVVNLKNNNPKVFEVECIPGISDLSRSIKEVEDRTLLLTTKDGRTIWIGEDVVNSSIIEFIP